ncbi:MAG: glycerophosphodiester phosphodiesterase family protein [Ardenticatenaceae bacterium]|nr:glycerophosphodiester phosphodiesterase family protein [Ardenticatenaceae bacterium]
MPTIFDRPKPYLMAHRGASDHAPENTLGSFRLALEAGADIIETDLWFTRDGELVCHHDATVARMTGRPGRVAEMTLSEVQSLRVRSRFDERFPDEHIPTLAELLDLLPPEVVLTVELKDPRFSDSAWAERLARQAAERVVRQAIVAISFRRRNLQGLRAAAPTFPIGHIAVVEPFPTQQVDVLGPFWPLLFVNPGYVAWAHRRGKWVCPLDPAPHKRLQWYLRLGVDAILTNDPAATRALIARERAAGRS